ncbi:MAG: DUF3540 domain-containing protein [Nitrospirota bacterium]|nr:DUF3540 domain-containing protein [Nitrospirota bacterium]MDE3242461.1 DUF3540 domain-containing protein [Nitrospirota bacterium]
MKTNLAKKPKFGEAYMELGLVEKAEEGGWLVRTDGGLVEAKRATGCLLEPIPSDLVLLSYGSKGWAYILSVLERRGDQAGTLSYEGALTLAAREGRLNLTSAQGLSLSSDKDLTVAVERLSVAAQEGEARVGMFATIGRYLQTQAEHITVVAEAWDSVVNRMTQKLKLNIRYVSEAEEVQAASLRQLVDGTMTIHAKNTNLIAEEHVKVDAEQIHLG